VIQRVFTADGAAREAYHALLTYTGLLNQGFAKVNAVAWAAAILLWSAAILRTGRLPRAPGIAGAVVGATLLLAVLSGHLRLDVHGFGIMTAAQAVWLVWIGVLLIRRRAVGAAS
jgi:hypothetical protein